MKYMPGRSVQKYKNRDENQLRQIEILSFHTPIRPQGRQLRESKGWASISHFLIFNGCLMGQLQIYVHVHYFTSKHYTDDTRQIKRDQRSPTPSQ